MPEDKIMRMMRIRNDQKLGTLEQLLIAIADLGRDIGEIRLIEETYEQGIRDINIHLDNETQLKNGLQTIAEITPPYEIVSNFYEKNFHKAITCALARKAIEHGLACAADVP
jgi:hypothetical protein